MIAITRIVILAGSAATLEQAKAQFSASWEASPWCPERNSYFTKERPRNWPGPPTSVLVPQEVGFSKGRTQPT